MDSPQSELTIQELLQVTTKFQNLADDTTSFESENGRGKISRQEAKKQIIKKLTLLDKEHTFNLPHGAIEFLEKSDVKSVETWKVATSLLRGQPAPLLDNSVPGNLGDLKEQRLKVQLGAEASRINGQLPDDVIKRYVQALKDSYKLSDKQVAEVEQEIKNLRTEQAKESPQEIVVSNTKAGNRDIPVSAPSSKVEEISLQSDRKDDSPSKDDKQTSPNSKLSKQTKEAIERAGERAEMRGYNPKTETGAYLANQVSFGFSYLNEIWNTNPEAISQAIGDSVSYGETYAESKSISKKIPSKAEQTVNQVAQAAAAASALVRSEQVQDVAAQTISAGQIGARRLKDKVGPVIIGTGIGAVAGLLTGNPLAVAGGAAAGGFMGYSLGDGRTRSVPPSQGGGSPSPQSSRRRGGILPAAANLANAQALKGIVASLGGAGLASIAGWILVGIGIAILIAILAIFFLNYSFQPSSEVLDLQGGPPIVTVSKTADIDEMGNFEEATVPQKIANYSIQISAHEGDVKISAKDDVRFFGESGTFDKSQMQATTTPITWPTSVTPTGSTVAYGIVIPVNAANRQNLNDGYLVNTVTITATDENGKSESRSAQAIIKVGNPPEGHPYGFPKSGSISSLDNEPIPAITGEDGKVLPAHDHCGEIPSLAGCIGGGLDITGEGQVKSTAEGYVIYSQFDSRLGGVVYILAGDHSAAFLHLAEEGLAPLGKISRGDTVGTVYPGKLPTSSGPHVHYQVFDGGQNVFFKNSASVGACENPNAIISPTNAQQLATRSIPAGADGDGTGNFSCNISNPPAVVN